MSLVKTRSLEVLCSRSRCPAFASRNEQKVVGVSKILYFLLLVKVNNIMVNALTSRSSVNLMDGYAKYVPLGREITTWHRSCGVQVSITSSRFRFIDRAAVMHP